MGESDELMKWIRVVIVIRMFADEYDEISCDYYIHNNCDILKIIKDNN